MSEEKKAPPHVVSQDQGAHDVALKHKDDESAGHHSGRPHPPKQKATAPGDDYAAGASQGPTSKQ